MALVPELIRSHPSARSQLNPVKRFKLNNSIGLIRNLFYLQRTLFLNTRPIGIFTHARILTNNRSITNREHTNSSIIQRWDEFGLNAEYETAAQSWFKGLPTQNAKDKEAITTTNDHLKRFKQGSMLVSEFNACFRSLVANTSLSVDSQIKIYERNLNQGTNAAAIGTVGWNTCSTLDDKMQWGIVVGGMASKYTELPSDHPLSTKNS
ncbi:hypothetical protein CROQUDRAFT_100691 [Cronartium quercuum f. sp. fusiforme G11]|uniref:Retrotransposon gag domain-containing protein n=1 Tax=Cronartium quercuum f. sp. fusiforme G11 TaxID=708437 RepID=A0A9P6N6X2_9BASI|nr:hypothetical protein CROQUDRAFT_100691 [Cronartium quercuum f. sp. fusiforme G11]